MLSSLALLATWRFTTNNGGLLQRAVHHAYLIADWSRDPLDANGIGAAGFGLLAFRVEA